MNNGRKKWPAVAFFGLLFIAVCGLSPFFGIETFTPQMLWGNAGGAAENQELLRHIFWTHRVPRVLCGILAGGTLALGGMVFQAVFRNPLATPFTLGTASGAALGASLAIQLGANAFLLNISASLSFSAVTLAAFAGAMLALLLVFSVVRLSGRFGDTEMLLAGVAVSFCFASLIMLVQYVSNPAMTARMLRWTMGGLDTAAGLSTCGLLLPWCVPAVAVLWLFSRELDLFCVGDETATARGVNIVRMRWILLTVTSLMVAAVVAVCGPIGFVGLMVPHIARHCVGASHRILFPVTFLGGAILLVACDTLARSVIPPDEIPVGVITALLGGPFFIGQLVFGGRK